MRLTPKKAIIAECNRCMHRSRGKPREDCFSDVCSLARDELGFVKRIRLHCLDCVAGNKKDVSDCDGVQLDGSTCNLHEFRFGKNPNRKGIGNKGNINNFGKK